MNHLARLPLCAGIAVVLAALCVSLFAKLGGSYWEENLNLTKWAEKLADEFRRGEALEVRGSPIFRRTFEKRRIVQELLAHRVTLLEAAHQFHDLNEEVRQVQAPKADPVALQQTDDEALCRNVIVWVRAELADEPNLADEVTEELEREVCELGGE